MNSCNSTTSLPDICFQKDNTFPENKDSMVICEKVKDSMKIYNQALIIARHYEQLANERLFDIEEMTKSFKLKEQNYLNEIKRLKYDNCQSSEEYEKEIDRLKIENMDLKNELTHLELKLEELAKQLLDSKIDNDKEFEAYKRSEEIVKNSQMNEINGLKHQIVVIELTRQRDAEKFEKESAHKQIELQNEIRRLNEEIKMFHNQYSLDAADEVFQVFQSEGKLKVWNQLMKKIKSSTKKDSKIINGNIKHSKSKFDKK